MSVIITEMRDGVVQSVYGEYADGSKEWYTCGSKHRTDRAAVERSDGSKDWWVDKKQSRAVTITHSQGERNVCYHC
jgi:hypothetical protein